MSVKMLLTKFVRIIGSSIITPGFADIEESFNVGVTASFLPFALFVVGLGFGPMIAAPISEIHGRKLVYLITFPPTIFFTIGAGFAQNFGTLLVCRFFAGTFVAPSLAVGAGSMSDMFPPIYRATSSGLWILMAFLGPVMGPPVASYAAMNKGTLFASSVIARRLIFVKAGDGLNGLLSLFASRYTSFPFSKRRLITRSS